MHSPAGRTVPLATELPPTRQENQADYLHLGDRVCIGMALDMHHPAILTDERVEPHTVPFSSIKVNIVARRIQFHAVAFSASFRLLTGLSKIRLQPLIDQGCW